MSVTATRPVVAVNMTPEEYAEWEDRNRIIQMFNQMVFPALEEQEWRRGNH